KPTNNLTEIKEAVGSIKRDDSGVERVFSAIYMAADQYRMLRAPDADTGQPARNVMLIAFTDEVGDDQDGLESTIRKCRQYEMPVYVVGVPAPFGRAETLVKWVDPDPSFDQTPQWGQVNQGPESFMPERIKLNFSGARNKDADPIDSGFGPFSLTRLCVETGGIYFAVHPNRNVNREVSRNETAEFSAHLKHFFDPNIMRKYRPDYVSQDEYVRRVSSNKARTSLLQAAKMSWISPMEEPQTRFVKRSEAEFANELSEAQKAAAKLEPRMQALYDVLKLGEADREKEVSPRWQAGYDLALGRVLAVKVRTEAYNAMLAAAKRGLKQDDPKSNTWILEPANEISVGSRMEKDAENARALLERVVNDHPGTPWALLAKQELENPVGWKWKEDFTDFSPPGNGGGGNGNAPAPANDAKRMMAKPAPKRAPPKL
ncbi:MAG: VWA domain-containing protein, partial [Planctomycetales bacterium]|nr:VWA domain-containing protein [Planctomycetales bacterium]